jgi:hypothetical protein
MRLGSAGAVLLLGVLSAAAWKNPIGTFGESPLERVSWLAGCFEMINGDMVVEEHRMAARAGTMLGMSRTTSARGLLEYELTLVRVRDGGLVFEAHPSGQPAAVFPAKVATADSIVFADPEHDYPQVVGYRRAGADSVIAWIDGTSRGKPRRVEFPYRRVRCPAPQ